MSKVVVFHDGKMCRAQAGKIVDRQAKRVKIEYYNSWRGEVVAAWFLRARREGGGAYEDRDNNYWFYPNRGIA